MKNLSKRIFTGILVVVMLLTAVMPIYATEDNQTPLSEESHFNIEGNYIKGIPSNVPGSTMLLNLKSDATLENPESLVGTGSEILYNGVKYTAVVLADVSGDGKIAASDYMLLKGYFNGQRDMSDAGCVAADVNEDGKIATIDYMRIKKQISGDIDLYRYMNELPDWEGPHVKELTIADTDISNYVIVIPDSAESPENIAANDLQKYIKIATGIELPIKSESSSNEYEICIGSTSRDVQEVIDARATLVNNGYSIICNDGTLYLSGNDATGTLYAVYSFLEDYVGCRFYSKRYETVKYSLKQNIAEGTNVTYSPSNIYREPLWYCTFDAEFAAKLKINGGMDRDFTGRSDSVSYSGGAFVHTLGGFSGVSGVDNQPCLTDPVIYETVLNNVLNCLRNDPDEKIISVSQNDSTDGALGCQCENCKAIDEAEGTPMGSLLTFINKLAEDVEKEFPDVYIDTLAYKYTRKAPKTIKPRDNVIIRLCTSNCCYSHPLNDESCEVNKDFREDIEAWGEICDNIFVWDYTTNFWFYNAPYPNFHVLRDNMKFFKDNNVIGILEQGNYQATGGEFEELRSYLLAKLLWNPDMTEQEYQNLIDDFLEGYYGDGWKNIREFIDMTCEVAAKGHMDWSINPKNIFAISYFSTSTERVNFAKKLETLFADALLEADEEHYMNVEKSSIQATYAYLIMRWNMREGPAKLQTLYDLMVKHNVGRLSEGQGLPEVPNFNQSLENWHWFK